MSGRVGIAGVLAIFALLGACEFRACLAQSDLFASLRPQLVEQCCACLAKNGTRHPSATCAQAYLQFDDAGTSVIVVDGGSDTDGGPGIAIPVDTTTGGVSDDADGVIQDDEVPCLCSTSIAKCLGVLGGDIPDASIPITGACIDQGGGLLDGAPCRNECDGVVTFDPLTAGAASN